MQANIIKQDTLTIPLPSSWDESDIAEWASTGYVRVPQRYYLSGDGSISHIGKGGVKSEGTDVIIPWHCVSSITLPSE